MSISRDSLIEERVAQLQEIRQRRNELVKEMYTLLQKRNEHDVELDSEHGVFDGEMDVVEYPEFSHIKDLLLLLPDDTASHTPGSRRSSPQAASRESTPAPSRASPQTDELAQPLESSMSEPPVSPPTQVIEELDPQLAESQPEPMEVDETEQVTLETEPHVSSPSPMPQDTSSPRHRSRSTTSPMQPDKQLTPKSRDSKSRSPSAQERPEVPPSAPVEEVMDYQLEFQPTVIVSEDLEVQPTTVMTKIEDTSEDIAMDILPYNPPLPIARIESEHSISEYVLEAKVAPDPPPLTFKFKGEPATEEEKTIAPVQTLYKQPTYALPLLKQLPPEFHRKGKQRQSRKRDKEKSESKASQEWSPLGLNRWSAILRANPIHKKVSKATKCLSTREWNVAVTELKLIKAFDRIDALIDAGRWSFRQPKKQRGVGGLMKTHWDYLLDEMRWMRTDFREERKWKMALAYSLAHAVLEWHEAGTLEERVRHGICVLWKRPRDTETQEAGVPLEGSDFHAFVPQEDQEQSGTASKSQSTPNADNSDEDSDEEQEREKQDVIDALDPAIALREAFEDAELQLDSQQSQSQSQDIQPKMEYFEDSSALQRESSTVPMEHDDAGPDNAPTTATKAEAAESSALKTSSDDPILGSQNDEAASSSKPRSKTTSVYAPLREQIIFSEPETLFLDLDGFDIVQGMTSLSTDDMSAPPPMPDLSEIFPDMQTFGLLDVPPTTGADGKKKSGRSDRDDPNKRAEDTTYMKVMPANEFMHHKATLVGPLQPSKHWDDEQWHDLDETAVVVEFESSSARPVDESMSSSLFDSVKSSPSSTPISLPPFKDLRRPFSQSLLETSRNPASMQRSNKPSDLAWTPHDDAVLKPLVERHPNNWILIAESFNSLRVTTSIDKRTPFDCFDRWRTRFGPPPNEDEHRPPPQTPTTPMTTRGTKRSLSTSVAPTAANSAAAPTESKKKRRHNLMYDTIRKAAKKREQAQKANANNRKPTTIHDTHGQYNKMPKLTPAELSRMKADADAREQQMQRKRQDDLRTQQQALAQQQQQQQQQQQHARMQQIPNMAVQNPGMRTPNGHPGAQGMPQIRQQVNISGQQQRLSNPLLGQTRIASSQLMQAQAAQVQAQARAIAAAQAQVQAQGQAHPNIANSLAAGAAPALTAHLTPNYNAARANSTSPGLPQQSPPLSQAAAANATSPRPPSAQALAGRSPQVQGSIASSAQRNAPTMAHYYPNIQTAHLTPEQLQHAMQIQTLYSQRQALQQQAAQQQVQQQQNGSYSMS